VIKEITDPRNLLPATKRARSFRREQRRPGRRFPANATRPRSPSHPAPRSPSGSYRSPHPKLAALAQGRYGPAADRYNEALQTARAAGDRNGQIAAMIGLGEIHLELGQYTASAGCYREVLQLAAALGSRNWELEGNLGLGRIHQASNHPEQALADHQQALILAHDLGQAPDEARAHDGLAHGHYALGHPDTARQHWQHALDILATLDTPVTDDITAADIRARLASIDTATSPADRP
jgi:tetratricopeptide (TPR) repeat protein